MVDEAGPAPKQAKTKSDVCFNCNYLRPCYLSPCIYKHQCLKCFEDHAFEFLDCSKRNFQRNTPYNCDYTAINNTISHYYIPSN